MRVDEKKFKESHRSFLRQRPEPDRKGCPSPEELVRLVGAEGSVKDKVGWVDHVFSCPSCARELEMILEIKRAEKALVRDFMRSPVMTARRPRFLARLRLSWSMAAAAVVFLAFGFIVQRFLISRSQEELRSGSVTRIELVRPAGNEIFRLPLVFEWKPVRGAESYVVQLFDEALAPLWESEKVTAIRLALPASIASAIAPGKPYFWLVTAHFPEGRRVYSPLKEFVLKNGRR